MGNKKKSKQLGMNHGTAQHRLRKMIMFSLIQQTGLDICHQCGKSIVDIDTLSIEHKVRWLNSEDPIGLFFDLDNIAFSHMKCNYSAADKSWQKRTHGKSGYTNYGCRCEVCTKANAESQRKQRARRVG